MQEMSPPWPLDDGLGDGQPEADAGNGRLPGRAGSEEPGEDPGGSSSLMPIPVSCTLSWTHAFLAAGADLDGAAARANT